MDYLYNVILQFINAWFPNDLSIELLKLNELLSYVITLALVFIFIKWILKLIKVIK